MDRQKQKYFKLIKNRKKAEFMEYHVGGMVFLVEKKTEWIVPEENDARVLTMPNIPKPLHTVAPRNYMGQVEWNKKRRRCYYEANYTDEIMGTDLGKGKCQAHELYDFYFTTKTEVFRRLICLSELTHQRGIHTGRMLTAFKNKVPYYSKKRVLEGVENTFRLIFEYNRLHNLVGENKIKPYYVWLSYLEEPELKLEVLNLIRKYNIEFWVEYNFNEEESWSDWKLIYGGKEYYSPFNSEKEWREFFEKKNEEEARLKNYNPLADFNEKFKELWED